ncbi:MAG: hypothetical protein EA394_07120 [Bacteroidia bacterium]|nr:MAG: hypothetical protein EA394_07120 [Bacteroidia bacterium]
MITAAAIIFSISMANANPNRNLVFTDKLGRTLIQPMKAEAEEAIPAVIKSAIQCQKKRAVYQIYDLTDMFTPETEDPIPAEVQKAFKNEAEYLQPFDLHKACKIEKK